MRTAQGDADGAEQVMKGQRGGTLRRRVAAKKGLAEAAATTADSPDASSPVSNAVYASPVFSFLTAAAAIFSGGKVAVLAVALPRGCCQRYRNISCGLRFVEQTSITWTTNNLPA